jgi:hypothetical protein
MNVNSINVKSPLDTFQFQIELLPDGVTLRVHPTSFSVFGVQYSLAAEADYTLPLGRGEQTWVRGMLVQDSDGTVEFLADEITDADPPVDPNALGLKFLGTLFTMQIPALSPNHNGLTLNHVSVIYEPEPIPAPKQSRLNSRE